MRILVPIEGSGPSDHAVRAAIRLAWQTGGEIHLLNVRPPLPQSISDFVEYDDVCDFHSERARNTLSSAVDLLDSSNINYRSAMTVGRGPAVIADYAADQRCSHIVMAVGGNGGLADFFYRRTPLKLLNAAGLPLTLVK
ncbi:universal stress protein [Azospirillum sp. ST 5-10]|uniref:universal stress protein n=1 Tax=unclassified Azospirillum TaxID=2630922 RepID=UPI003F4A3456